MLEKPLYCNHSTLDVLKIYYLCLLFMRGSHYFVVL